MRVARGAAIRQARRFNSMLMSRGVDGIRSKALRANDNVMAITGQEVLNSFMAAGLSSAGVGAAVGAGYGLLSGGNIWEGAKSGAMIGAGWGTARNMSMNRAQLAKRAFNIDVGDGLFAGFRAQSMVRDLIDQGPGAVQRAIRQADEGAAAAVSNYMAKRTNAARAVRNRKDAAKAIDALDEAAAEMAAWAPSVSAMRSLERRTRSVVDSFSAAAARRAAGARV